MDSSPLFHLASTLAPATLMAALAGWSRLYQGSTIALWRSFQGVAIAACVIAGVSLGFVPQGSIWTGVLATTPFGLVLALLVQLLGTTIGAFSARYLQGEANQRRYVTALAAVLAGVHLLLLADHWLLLIAAWTSVGLALQHLLCIYPDRPFARLAAHKKRMADVLADALLLCAAVLAWAEVGSGSLQALWTHVDKHGTSVLLQCSAVALVLAVVLRTALMPVHGWLIQVMEAPTPVSALLHAGVINLGGFVLIRFAPLLEQATLARALLLVVGLATAVLAGMVMLTRISIKVRLAWSTVAQMGFMLLECALGLYTLAALHLVGHSLYKAHAFLSASSVVRQTRLQALHTAAKPTAWSLVIAPAVTMGVVLQIAASMEIPPWPWWWSMVLGLAWAPLLWMPTASAAWSARATHVLFGLAVAAALTLAAIGAHALPLGIQDAPHHTLGLIALVAMAAMHAGQTLLQRRPQVLSRWRRWSYAGFYLDEAYTRLALRLWPTAWTPAPSQLPAPLLPGTRT